MTDFFYLIPVALVLGAVGPPRLLWSLRSGQYEDLDGAAERILFDEDTPLKGTGEERRSPHDQMDAKGAVHSIKSEPSP
jgi:cbb3-type cytochrome oxidase maturation protein